MIDPETTKPGDWVRSAEGLSQVLCYYIPNSLRQPRPPASDSDIYGPDPEEGLCPVIKTICNWEYKPKLKRYMVDALSPGGCSPFREGDAKIVERIRENHPKTWEQFENIVEPTISQTAWFRGGDWHMPDIDAVRDEIIKINDCRPILKQGLTLNRINKLFHERGIQFDFWYKPNNYQIDPPYSVNFSNIAFRHDENYNLLLYDIIINLKNSRLQDIDFGE